MQYISNTEKDKQEMLGAIGVSSFESLIANIPKRLRDFKLKIPAGISELELDRELDETGSRNKNFKYYIPYIPPLDY